MQLKLQRSQRTGGVLASTILFCLDVRADYEPEEKANINRYKLGGQTIYSSRAAQKHFANAGTQLDRTEEGTAGNRLAGLARGAASMALARMQLNISIASLGRGHHIECKDLQELLESEDTIRNACKDLTRYLEVASTFNGSEVVVEYVNGEEKVHLAQGAPPLLGYEPSSSEPHVIDAECKPVTNSPVAETLGELTVLGQEIKAWWMALEGKILTALDKTGDEATRTRIRIAASLLGAFLLFVLFKTF